MTDIGQVFNSLTFMGMASKSEAFFLCECGETVQVKMHEVKSGKRKTCGGTAHKQVSSIEGSSTNYQRENVAFLGMLDKFAQISTPPKLLQEYWVRPKLHPQWNPRIVPNAFENFYADIGPKPSGFELGMRDPAGDFDPQNILWIKSTKGQRRKAGGRTVASRKECEADRSTTAEGIRRALNELKSELKRDRSQEAAQPDHRSCHPPDG